MTSPSPSAIETSRLDIVELIDKNPITRLSPNYRNRFVDKITDMLQQNEQQLYVGSLYCFLNYDSNDFLIDIDRIWRWLGFSRKDHCKTKLESFAIINVDYIVQIEQASSGSHGGSGQNKETILLNIETFKELCLNAKTSKATEIRKYYIKLEKILHKIICEESQDFKMKLLQNEERLQIEQNKVLQEQEKVRKIQNEQRLEKHNLLLREYGSSGALVYIIKVKSYENGEYVIKIGESRIGVEDRYNEHETNYDEALILDCFSVNQSKKFETFLHNHPDIRPNKIINLPNHERENELFLIGRELTYDKLLKIINDTIIQFNDIVALQTQLEQTKLDNERYDKLMNMDDITKDHIKGFVETNKQLVTMLSNMQTIMISMQTKMDKMQESIDKLENPHQLARVTHFGDPLQTLGPHLQKINPETLQLVKWYDTVTDCMTENPTIKRPSLTKAIDENTIYKGFRWQYVTRGDDQTVVQNLQPTIATQKQVTGYIAKLNKDRTEIVNVYLDKNTAVESNATHLYTIEKAIERGHPIMDNYYMLYDNVDDELKENFPIPILYKNGVGKFDENDNLVKEFTCKYECIRSKDLSEKMLKQALKNPDKPYNGHYFYKLLPEKKSC